MSPNDRARLAAPSAARLLILTAVFPGLGHLVSGRRRWALILALPILVLVGMALLALLGESALSLGARLFDPAVLGVLLAVQVFLLLWRLGALGAVRQIRPLRATASTIVAGVVAVSIIVVPSLYVANLTVDARDAAAEVYQPVDSGAPGSPTRPRRRSRRTTRTSPSTRASRRPRSRGRPRPPRRHRPRPRASRA